jgi:molybdate transport system ATP-binding protein
LIDIQLRLRRRQFTLDVALRLPVDQATALVGPSGCGKTTALRAIAGLTRPAGRVVIGDRVWQDDATGRFMPPHQRDVGYVSQEASLFAHLDVRRNLEFGLKRLKPGSRRVSLEQAVALLNLSALMSRDTDALSGGERQRVAIARALLTSPQLLLLDEPLTGLDAPRKAEVLACLRRLHKELAIPVIYVTHAMDEVRQLASHLVLLEAGRVSASGPIDTVLRESEPARLENQPSI